MNEETEVTDTNAYAREVIQSEIELSDEDKKFILDRHNQSCAITKKKEVSNLIIHKILKDGPNTANNLILIHKQLAKKANRFYESGRLEFWYQLHPNDLLDVIDSDLSYGNVNIHIKVGDQLIPRGRDAELIRRQKGAFKRYAKFAAMQKEQQQP